MASLGMGSDALIRAGRWRGCAYLGWYDLLFFVMSSYRDRSCGGGDRVRSFSGWRVR